MSNSKIKLGLLALAFLLLTLLSAKFFKGSLQNSYLGSFNLVSTFTFDFTSSGLAKIVRNNLVGKKGDYSIYIEDLSDPPAGGEIYNLNANTSFPAASLYKLFLIAAAIEEVEEGRLKMDDQINSTKTDLIKKFGSLDFGYEDMEEKITFTVEEALVRVSRISDNFASIMLAEKIGWDKVQAQADQIGAKTTDMKDPITTSAFDIALFFKKLRNKEIVSPQVSDRIVQFLLLNQLNNRIPAKLPEGVKVIHKTGELSRVRHDAGIVFLTSETNNSNRLYVIVLMSKDLQYEDQGVETLARISKEVYEYFKAKSNLTN